MTTFLITSTQGTSEWKNSFSDVQIEMNKLEKNGIVSNVKVQQFINMVLNKEFNYNYNGEQWEK